ncbi:DinB family protein [Kribbella deserti]|uniref:DinB family protein n=1 Tax=Kribbella deserti TaxID=1926257 RepID=A0ABV6QKU0_9ACTN
MPSSTRAPRTGDERSQIVGMLDHQRRLVRMKCQGLSEADAHRPVLPASPLMTMAGVVAHLRWVEYAWFHLNLLGIPETDQTPWKEGGHVDAEMFVDDVPLDQLLDEYDEEWARSNAIAASHSLDDLEKNPGKGEAASVRYILLHLIEETARHLGHLDAIRELLDGITSYEVAAESPAT